MAPARSARGRACARPQRLPCRGHGCDCTCRLDSRRKRRPGTCALDLHVTSSRRLPRIPPLEVVMLEILGVTFSVHTRKVLLALREKNLPFELQPVIPLSPPPGWRELSPLGKIPVLRTPELTVPDSS